MVPVEQPSGHVPAPQLANPLLPKCYEHARDQGILGSVAGCRYNRTPRRTHGLVVHEEWRVIKPRVSHVMG
jgi:hypothetical protein